MTIDFPVCAAPFKVSMSSAAVAVRHSIAFSFIGFLIRFALIGSNYSLQKYDFFLYRQCF
jgi:hypothetical protein